MPLPDKVSRVKEVNHHYQLLSKQHSRLGRKIAVVAEKAIMVVDEEIHIPVTICTDSAAYFVATASGDSCSEVMHCIFDTVKFMGYINCVLQSTVVKNVAD